MGTSPGLVIFDMDRTLLKGRVVMTWAEAFGVRPEVERIIADRQAGRIDGIVSARRIARLWKGRRWQELKPLLDAIPLNPGAQAAVASLGRAGVPTAILTDSYQAAAHAAAHRVDAQAALGLDLEEADGVLTGEVRAPAGLGPGQAGCDYSFLCKEVGLRHLARRFDVPLERTVMVGDSDPDACAMRVAGRGIAYRPLGRRVMDHASDVCDTDDLREVLGILGVAETAPTT